MHVSTDDEGISMCSEILCGMSKYEDKSVFAGIYQGIHISLYLRVNK